jgi:hypothetical protein
MGIAGVSSRWKKPGGGEFFSFAMITVRTRNSAACRQSCVQQSPE